MRHLEFRAWDKNEMVYFDLGGRIKNECAIFTDVDKDAILMQFTGLLDKHGKKIFEGDVLSGHEVEYCEGHIISEYQILSEVKWDDENGLWIVIYHPNGEKQWLYDCPIDEVIGNIYEHPELIEVKQ